MEAFALQKIRKRNLEEELKKKVPIVNVLTQEELATRNKLMGLPDPPISVYAIGKSEAAAVWWSVTDGSPADITGWEIHRYRKNPGKVLTGEWKYKGYVSLGVLPKKQSVVNDLTDGYQYRFTVKAINVHGTSCESPFSNAIMVEQPLPTGWFRFHDDVTDLFFYANVKTKQSSWERPEKDPYFLDEQIILNFSQREIDHLKGLFEEDIQHSRMVTLYTLLDIFTEVGEKVSERVARNLLREFGDEEELTPKLSTWIQFMTLMNHVKTRRMTPLLPLPKVGIRTLINRQVTALMFRGKKESIAHWSIRYSKLAEREYYINTITHEKRWCMPDEVRFYISPKLMTKLFTIFNFGHVDAFKRYFSMLDVDGSGDLSAREVMLLFDKLNIQVTDKLFNRLLVIVDLNNNGTVEFDEFCWMMYMLAKKSKVWRDIRKYNNRLQRQQQQKNAAGNKNTNNSNNNEKNGRKNSKNSKNVNNNNEDELNPQETIDNNLDIGNIGEKIMKMASDVKYGTAVHAVPLKGVPVCLKSPPPDSNGHPDSSAPMGNEDNVEGGIWHRLTLRKSNSNSNDDVNNNNNNNKSNSNILLAREDSWASISSNAALEIDNEMNNFPLNESTTMHSNNGSVDVMHNNNNNNSDDPNISNNNNNSTTANTGTALTGLSVAVGSVVSAVKSNALAASSTVSSAWTVTVTSVQYVSGIVANKAVNAGEDLGDFIYERFFEESKKISPLGTGEVGPHGPYCMCGCRSN